MTKLGIKETVAKWKGRLEQKPCEDAVSRQAVLDILSHYAHNFGADNEIKALPPVTPTPKWIPVSERLPKNAFGCLVTVEEDDIHGEPQRVIYPNFVGYDGETWNDADGKAIPFDVIAWMPLPKPYNAEMESGE